MADSGLTAPRRPGRLGGPSRRLAPFRMAIAQLRSHPTRMLAVLLAIVLGVGFVAATVVFGATYRAGLGAVVSARFAHADVVVDPPTVGVDAASGQGSTDQLLELVRNTPGVAYVEDQPTAWTPFSSAGARGTMRVDSVPGDERLRWFGLSAGTWPVGTAQILVDSGTATSANLQIGSQILLSGGAGGLTVTVVGIADTSVSARQGAEESAYGTPGLVTALASGSSTGPIVVVADTGVSPNALADRIASSTAPTGAAVQTGSAKVDAMVAQITGGARVLTIVLLGFAVIAVVASAIVIANTFTILIAQRRRHIALTRCIGASRAQVRAEVLAEAFLLGAAGSAMGVVVGIGVALLGSRLAGLDGGGPVIPLAQIGTALLGGIAMTMVAAYAPAARAMRITPLAALQPVADAAEERRSSLMRNGIAGVLTVGGVVLLVTAVRVPSVLLGMAGGALSACGILLLTGTFLPWTIRLIGRSAAVFGPPGRLAAANAARNPGRAAGTTAALMLGVGLIVTLQVGAATAEKSLDRAISERFPVDLGVTATTTGAVPASVAKSVGQVEGIASTGMVLGTTVSSAQVLAGGGSSSVPSEPSEGDPAAGLAILGVGPAAAATLDAAPATLQDDTVIVPDFLLRSGLAEGQRITIRTATGNADFTVAAGRLSRQGNSGDAMITTAAGLARLQPEAPVVAVWAALTTGADPGTVSAAVNRLIVTEPDLTLGGSAAERASMRSTLGTVLALATALLAVAVIIAVVGIGNTLGLSVIERTRESALLRALGLHRRQLRLMLAIEAALLAAVGAAVGVLAGIGYGWVGAASAFQQAGAEPVLDIPWGHIGLVLVLAVCAGLLASVLPARRAATATPTQALADI